MIYFTIAVLYLDSHIWWVVMALALCYISYIAVNVVLSPYFWHNIALRRSIRQLRCTASSGKVVPFVASIPLQYRAQWHCYTTAHSVPAVSMFTPTTAVSNRRCVVLLVLSHMLALICAVVAVLRVDNVVALYAMAIYIGALFPMYVLLRVVRTAQYNSACRIFGRWVSLVQAYFGNGSCATARQAKPADIEDMIQQLRLVSRCSGQDVQSRVASILSSQPQDVERTVSQQRRINNVLNDLLVVGG